MTETSAGCSCSGFSHFGNWEAAWEDVQPCREGLALMNSCGFLQGSGSSPCTTVVSGSAPKLVTFLVITKLLHQKVQLEISAVFKNCQ